MIHPVEELTDLAGVRVLVRAALNVPIENGRVTDTLRVDLAMKTVSYLLARNARVILMSHLSDSKASLAPVYDYLRTKIPVTLVSDVAGVNAHAAATALKDGQALLLENLRWNAGEKANDEQFARELASLGDVYIADDFTVLHRMHAAVVGVPKFLPSYAGFQLLAEFHGLVPALSPESPSIAIVGGAKLVTKLALIKSLLAKYDRVFVGGALANDFFAAKGYDVGKSLVSGGPEAGELLSEPKIILPETVTVSNAAGRDDVAADAVGPEDVISDIAPASIQELKPVIDSAHMVLWNGPMGHFETGFTEGTDELAKLIAQAPGKSVVGGGDTLSSIHNLGLFDKFTFVSTAGGAMLDFLATGTLPGLQALER
ncbi:MAG: phosphoglycerate kinase [Patescibacteria group bacterium]|nr:phosphoglycerate kinase [Patescibacteria group bacterium]